MGRHRASQICRKQFSLDKQETERKVRNAVTTRKRRMAEIDKKPLFPEVLTYENVLYSMNWKDLKSCTTSSNDLYVKDFMQHQI